MNEKLAHYLELFNEQPIRLRLLLTFVAVVMVGLAVDFLWIADNYTQAKSLKNEIIQTENKISELINTQNALNNKVVSNRNHPLIKQIEQVESDLVKVKKVLDEKTINLIKPELMSGVLTEIIKRSDKLKLLSLSKMPPVELFNPQDKELVIQIYRHSVEIAFEGQYSDTQNFLVLLEDMPQKVNFESLDYQVDKHPLSKIKLVVSTLSFDRKWIGG